MTDYEYLSATRNFLLKYPYPAPYQDLLIDYEQIIEMQNSDCFGAGAALLLAGDSIVSKIENKNWSETSFRHVGNMESRL